MKLKSADGKLRVSDLLNGLEENERDVIEEICVEHFNEKKNVAASENVEVKKKKFIQWFSEGKIDNFEAIKFYLISKIFESLK